jgi:2-dehydropantoate 2-reductase
MKVLVFGTGGVGGIYAYILEKGGAEVTAVCRSNYDAVVANGIAIDSDIFGNVHARPTAVKSVEDAKGPFDYILVTAKAFPGTSKYIAAAVSPGTAIVLGQNGIDTEAEYAEAYPNNIIISGVVYLPTTQTSPGIIRMGPLQVFHIGTYPAKASPEAKKAVQDFFITFSKGGGGMVTHDDVQQQRWIKLLANVPWNPSCALTRCDDANFLRSSPEAEIAVRGLMAEVTAVSGAAGYPISAEVIEEQLSRPKSRMDKGGKEPSMLTDVRWNRPLEVEAILGNTIKVARRLKVETPRLDLIYALTKGLDYSIKPDDRWTPIAM